MAVRVSLSSRAVKRAVGPIGWLVLEDLALEATRDNRGRLVARTTHQRLADNLGLSASTVARHLTRLCLDGYVLRERRNGQRAACYVIDDAAGVATMTGGQSLVSAAGQKFVTRLTDLGVRDAVAQQLVREHPESRIDEALEAVAAVNAHSPAGWVVTAIRRHWDLSDAVARARAADAGEQDLGYRDPEVFQPHDGDRREHDGSGS